ncbi:MAG: hypothetical protein CMB80_24815 [Flammeovirgaceae bacterium]|nr:hypothetical protein [Flammeovirgaceae bacterium]MBE63148.1 hypothetical protein [Flammeovirgaceae bacterium]HCX23080.1 hypothetical protein [Cytophagales bacterium]
MYKLICFILLIVLCWTSFAQSSQISITSDSIGLKEVITLIEQQTGTHFSYNSQDLPTRSFQFAIHEASMDAVLKEILQPFFLSAEQVKDNFYLIKKINQVYIQTYDAENTPLPFSTIEIQNTSSGTITNQDGLIRLTLSDPYRSSLKVSFVGYQSQVVDLSSVGYQDTIKIYLNPSVRELSEVVIEYLNKGIATNADASKISINPQEMQILPGLAEQDVLLSAQLLPGIQSNDESASGIQVRGASRDQTFYYWNNIPIYNPAHYFGNVSTFIPASVSSLDIYKSYVPVQYGGAASGLFLAKSRKPDIQFMTGANLNMTHADVFVGSQLPKSLGQLMIAARRSYNDLLVTPTFDAMTSKIFDGSTTALYQTQLNDGFDYNSHISFADYNAAWDIDFTPKDHFQLSYLYSNGRLDFNSQDQEEIGETNQLNNTRNKGFGSSWKHLWTSNSTITLEFARTNYEQEYTNVISESFNNYQYSETRQNDLINNELRITQAFHINEKHYLDIGFQQNWYSTRLKTYSEDMIENETEVFENEQLANASVTSFFSEWSGVIGEKWKTSFGQRVSALSNDQKFYFAPQAKLSYQLTNNLLLKTSAGIYHQFLTGADETDFTLSNTPEQFWMLGDTEERFSMIQNKQINLGGVFSNRIWLIDMEMYSKLVTGLDARKISLLLDPYFNGDEQIYGLDLLIKRQWKNWNTWVSYTYQHSSSEIRETDLKEISSQYNIPHWLQLATTYEKHSWELSLGYTIRSGRPYTKAIAIEELQSDEGTTYLELVYDQVNSNRLPVYNRLDLSCWYHFINRSNKLRADIGFSLLNLTNYKNIFDRRYTISDDENNPEIIENDYLLYGITPNLSLRIKI